MQHVTLDGYNLAVQQINPDIRALLLTEAATGSTIMLPLPNDIAEKIGRDLQGSRLEVAPATILRPVK